MVIWNFVREHGALATTPAVRAGIDLDLGENKIETLIRLASKRFER